MRSQSHGEDNPEICLLRPQYLGRTLKALLSPVHVLRHKRGLHANLLLSSDDS